MHKHTHARTHKHTQTYAQIISQRVTHAKQQIFPFKHSERIVSFCLLLLQVSIIRRYQTMNSRNSNEKNLAIKCTVDDSKTVLSPRLLSAVELEGTFGDNTAQVSLVCVQGLLQNDSALLVRWFRVTGRNQFMPARTRTGI